MPDWIPTLIEVIVLGFIAWERRQTRKEAHDLRTDVGGANRALVSFVRSSLRPPPADCEHDPLKCMIFTKPRGELQWCGQCGALKINGGPWRSPGDDDTPTTGTRG